MIDTHEGLPDMPVLTPEQQLQTDKLNAWIMAMNEIKVVGAMHGLIQQCHANNAINSLTRDRMINTCKSETQSILDRVFPSSVKVIN